MIKTLIKNKKGSFIDKNVNLFLIALVVILLLTLVGLTLYYEQNYTELSDTFSGKVEELNKITDDLSTHKSALNETRSQVQKQEESNSYFEGLYVELKAEKENVDTRYNLTKDQLDKTQSELSTTKTSLREESKRALDLTGQVATLKNELAVNDRLIDDIADQLDDLDDYIDNLLDNNETMYSRSKLSDINEDLYYIIEDFDDLK